MAVVIGSDEGERLLGVDCRTGLVGMDVSLDGLAVTEKLLMASVVEPVLMEWMMNQS